jgi:acetoacetate decarboxylase
MLTGYTLPRTPGGLSSHIPAPPWHFIGDMLVIEYWADPKAAAAALPSALEPSADPGRMTAIFVDWQSCRDDGAELSDPVRSQYREFLITVGASYKGREVAFCPHIWVTADFSLVRGLIQGFPKKLGSVAISRTFGMDSPANPSLAPGGRFVGTAAACDRRLAQAAVTLQGTTTTLSPHFAVPVVNVRYFPRLGAGSHDDPAVNELVRVVNYDRQMSDIWEGSAELELFDVPWEQEFGKLGPVRVGRGFRFTYAYSINDLRTIEQL